MITTLLMRRVGGVLVVLGGGEDMNMKGPVEQPPSNPNLTQPPPQIPNKTCVTKWFLRVALAHTKQDLREGRTGEGTYLL